MIMRMSKIKFPSLVCGIGMSVLALVGCGSKDPSEAVRQRAIERWDLLGGRHAVKAYDYLSPGYRSTHTLEQYVAFVATSRVQWKSAKVNSVKCDEEVCTLNLGVRSVIPGTALSRPSDLELEAPVTEKWVRSEGQWFFLPDVKINPQGIAKEASDATTEAKEPSSAGAQENPAPSPLPPPAEEGKKDGTKHP